MPKERFVGENTVLTVRWGNEQDAALNLEVGEKGWVENRLVVGLDADGVAALIKTLQRVEQSLTVVEVGDIIEIPSIKFDNLPDGTSILTLDGPSKGRIFTKKRQQWKRSFRGKTMTVFGMNYGKYVVTEVPADEFESFEPHASTGPHLQVTYNNAVNNGAGPVDDSDVDSVYPGDAVDSTPLV